MSELPLLLPPEWCQDPHQLLQVSSTSSFPTSLSAIIPSINPSLRSHLSISHLALHPSSPLVFMAGKMPTLLPRLHSLSLTLSLSPRCPPLHSQASPTTSHSLSGRFPRL